MFHTISTLCLVILSLCIVAALFYVARSPRFTDRLVGINFICTMILNAILVLVLVLNNTSILDIDVVYALLSFQAVVVLSRILRVKMLSHREQEGGRRA